jgi:hypothetical protein
VGRLVAVPIHPSYDYLFYQLKPGSMGQVGEIWLSQQ